MNDELRRAAAEARAAVQAVVAAVPRSALVEVMAQYDGATPCSEPSDAGPATLQWSVSSRVFVRRSSDATDVLDRLCSADQGWRVIDDRRHAGEPRVQVERGQVAVTVAVAASDDNPQAVVTGLTRCFPAP